MGKMQKNVAMDFMNKIRKVQGKRKGLIMLSVLKSKAFISQTKFPQPGAGHGNPHHYSCLENPMDKRSLVGYGP